MAARRCDGTDPNLTRQVPGIVFDEAVMTLARNWAFTATDGNVVIQCQCGLVFDDVDRLAIYPHEFIGQQPLPGMPC